jgi:hypothetical protein
MQDLICTYVKRLLNMCKKHNEYTDFHLFLIEKRNWSIIGTEIIGRLPIIKNWPIIDRLIGLAD